MTHKRHSPLRRFIVAGVIAKVFLGGDGCKVADSILETAKAFIYDWAGKLIKKSSKLEQKIRGEAAKDKKGKNGNERVACSCRRQSRFIEHVNP